MYYSLPLPVLNAVGYNNINSFLEAGGAVLLIAKTFDGKRYVPYGFQAGNMNFSFFIDQYSLYILVVATTGSIDELYTNPSNGNQFRYVLIAPEVQLSGQTSSARSAENID